MKRKLVWAADARRDLREAISFIADRNATAASRIERIIADGVQRALDFPFAARPGRVAGTRESVVHPNYIIVYRVMEDRVRIVRVLHARQRYP